MTWRGTARLRYLAGGGFMAVCAVVAFVNREWAFLAVFAVGFAIMVEAVWRNRPWSDDDQPLPPPPEEG